MIGAVVVGGYVLILDLQIVNVALPAIQGTLHASLAQLQWIIDAYALTLASTLLVAGAIADRWGLAQVYRLGVALFLLTSVGCALMPSVGALIAMRALQGIGGGILFAVGPALLGDRLDGPVLARAYGLYAVAVAIAFGTAPLVGGVCLQAFGWRSVFCVGIPAALLMSALLAGTRTTDPDSGRTIGLRSAGLFASSLGLLLFGLVNLGGQAGTARVWIPVVVGLLGLTVFVRAQNRSPSPLLDVRLLKVPVFAAASIAAFTLSATVIAAVAGVSLYFQTGRGVSPLLTGLAVAPLALGLVVGSAASATIDRLLGRVRLLLVSLALMAVGFLLLAVAAARHAEVVEVAIALCVCGCGHGALNPAIFRTTAAAAGAARQGAASGLSNTFRQVGVAVGVALLGSLFAAEVGSGVGSPTEIYADALRDLALAAALACAVSVLVVRLLTRRDRRPAAIAPGPP